MSDLESDHEREDPFEPTQTEPLHVSVAKALGCKPVSFKYWHIPSWRCTCQSVSIHNGPGVDGAPFEGSRLQDYNTDWAATGPLIEKFGIHLLRVPAALVDPRSCFWIASVGEFQFTPAMGESPLIAVCNLIVALAAEGKLPR